MAVKIGKPDVMTRQVKLEGFTPILFDRYPGDNDTNLSPGEKMYFLKDGRTLCLPSLNIISFLSSQRSACAAKLLAGRNYKKLAMAFMGFVKIEPLDVPLCRNGEAIAFNGFTDGRDEKANIEVLHAVGRVKGSVPVPVSRPLVHLPWELSFKISIISNEDFDEEKLYHAFTEGGMQIGFGSWRGMFGKFLVAKWE
jgi:hypothetical protein